MQPTTFSNQKSKTKNHFYFYYLQYFSSKTTDDVQDDESHWQDRVSSGFDRLVAFASTELDKTRRSIEDSCNTSPDSGINNSDGRNFLSSSSSSSQIDVHPTLLKSLPEQIDSPPLSESGRDNLPKTPSPTASPPVIYSSQNHQSLSSIPLKYQRQSKSSSSAASEKHYKKKFRDRTWEYDFDDANMDNHQQHHKSSKFRPKGKGWGWNSDQRT